MRIPPRLGLAVTLLFATPAIWGSDSCRPPHPLETITHSGLSVPAGSEYLFSYDVPADASNLFFLLTSEEGNADLYVAFDRYPTTSDYDCSSTNPSNDPDLCFGDTSAHPDGGTYFARVVAVTDISNATLKTTYRRPPGSWTVPKRIVSGSIGNTNPRVAVDPDGNAIAVWYQHNGVRWSIYASRFTPQEGWGAEELLENSDAGHAFAPQVAIDANGNAIAVWYQHDGVRHNIYANRFTPDNGWGDSELIEANNAGGAADPQLAIEPNGSAIAVWYQYDGIRYNIHANRFTPEGGWGEPHVFETDDSGYAGEAEVAIDPNGNAVVVWSHWENTTRLNILASHFTPEGGWGEPELLDHSDAAVFNGEPQVVVGSNGNAIAIWSLADETEGRVSASQFTPGGGWGAPQVIDTQDGFALSPRLGMDDDGNVIAIWSQLTDLSGASSNIWSNRLTPDNGWGIPQPIETDGASRAELAVGPDGDAVAVWLLDNETVRATRFTPEAGWSDPQTLDTYSSGVAGPDVAIGPNGHTMSIWRINSTLLASRWL